MDIIAIFCIRKLWPVINIYPYILLPPTIISSKPFVIVRTTCSQSKHSTTRRVKTYFEKISYWSFQWKRSFNQDPNKQKQDVAFNRKIFKSDHRPLVFNNNYVTGTSSWEHFTIILDKPLSFDDKFGIKFW